MTARTRPPGAPMATIDAGYAPFAHAALPEYGFGGEAHVELLSLSENGTYLVREGRRRLVLRVHRPGYHDLPAIESELLWIQHVRASSGIRTPEAIPAKDGSLVTAVEIDGQIRHVDAMTVVPGATAEDSGAAVPFDELGRIAATMHLLALEWDPPEGFTRFRWDIDTTIGDSPRWGAVADGPGVTAEYRALLADAAGEVASRLRDYGQSRERFGLVHSDIRLSNIMVDPDGTLTVIDFDDLGWSWFLTDLGAVVSWIEDEEGTPEIVRDWVAGYRQVRALSDEDLTMIPTFVMLRRLMLTAWLGTHPDSPPFLQLGDRFARGSALVARRYLDDPQWMVP